jgi:hypothetical protein
MENFKFEDYFKPHSNVVVVQEVKKYKTGDITPSGLIIGAEGKSSTPEADGPDKPTGESLGLRVVAVGPDVKRVKSGELIMLFPNSSYVGFEIFGDKYFYTLDFNVLATLAEDADEVNKIMEEKKREKAEAVRIASLAKVLNKDSNSLN